MQKCGNELGSVGKQIEGLEREVRSAESRIEGN